MTAKGAARVIGVLLLLHMVGSGVGNFVLLGPVLNGPGFLVNAAAHSTAMGLTALLGIATGSLIVAMAITAFPVFRPHSQRWALWFFALAVVGFSVAVVENINLMSLLSLSQAYAKASAADREHLQFLRVVVASARNWAHFLGLFIGGGTFLVFYIVQYRFTLIPRVLAAVGVAAVLSQMTSVALPLFGHEVVFPMLAPLGLCHLITALWLIVKGWPAGEAGITDAP